jgi:hypothetical protein
MIVSNGRILYYQISDGCEIWYVKCQDLRELGLDGVDWIDVAQDRDQWRALVNTVMNLRVP